MTIKQIKSTVGSLAAVASVAMAATVVNAWLDHQLIEWQMFPDILKHAALFAVVCMFGWVLLSSPWAPEARKLIGSLGTVEVKQTAEGTTTITATAGQAPAAEIKTGEK